MKVAGTPLANNPGMSIESRRPPRDDERTTLYARPLRLVLPVPAEAPAVEPPATFAGGSMYEIPTLEPLSLVIPEVEMTRAEPAEVEPLWRRVLLVLAFTVALSGAAFVAAYTLWAPV